MNVLIWLLCIFFFCINYTMWLRTCARWQFDSKTAKVSLLSSGRGNLANKRAKFQTINLEPNANNKFLDLFLFMFCFCFQLFLFMFSRKRFIFYFNWQSFL